MWYNGRMKITYALAALGAVGFGWVAEAADASPKKEPVYASPEHDAAMELFRDRKLGLMMHFGLYAQVGIIESWPLSDKDAHWSRREMERELAGDGFKAWYFGLSRSFNPVRFNPDTWAKAAVDGGFKYVVFTTKHHDGFCLYDTKETNYKTTDPSCPFSSNKNADVVKTLFDACRKQGLGVTAYFSKADWHHDDFWENAGIGRTTDRNPTYDATKNPEKWNRFKEFNKRQMLELVRDYGPLDALWLDGGWVGWNPSLGIPEAIAEARKINPALIAIDRCAGTCEDVRTPEQTVPEKPLDYPWESCITMADNWGYHYDDEYKSADEIIKMLVDIVAKGGNLALNVGPMPDGRLPRPALERMAELGQWLRRHGEAIYATRVRAPYKRDKWAFTQSKDGKRTFAIRLWHRREAGSPQAYFPDDAAYGKVARVVHLATKREIPFVRVDNPALDQHGVVLHFPADFANDPHADAFEFFFK